MTTNVALDGLLPGAFAAQLGMRDAQRALDAAADSIATEGPTVESMVDLVVQPSLYAANARAHRAASSLDILA